MLKFKCPECGCNRLESIETEGVIGSTISNINEDGDFRYYSPTIYESFVDRFECEECSYILKNKDGTVSNNLEVVEWINKNCSKQ